MKKHATRGGIPRSGQRFRPLLLLRNTRKTVTVSSAPPKELASSFDVWRRASAPFALLRSVLKEGGYASKSTREAVGNMGDLFLNVEIGDAQSGGGLGDDAWRQAPKEEKPL
jgi:hypothetical protein